MEFDEEPLLPSNMSEQNKDHNQKFDENCTMVDEEELNDWLNPPNPQTELEALELNMQSVAPENGKTNLTEMQVDELETNKMDSNSPSNVKNKQGGGGQSNESGASNQQQFAEHEQAVPKQQVQPNHVNNLSAEHVIDSTSPAFDDQQHSFANSFVAQKHAEQLNHSNSPGTWSSGTITMPMSRQHQNRYACLKCLCPTKERLRGVRVCVMVLCLEDASFCIKSSLLALPEFSQFCNFPQTHNFISLFILFLFPSGK